MSVIFGLSLGLENFPKNPKFCNFFPFRSKKISSGQIKKYPGHSQVSPLFTVGQKYARVKSGLISTQEYTCLNPG